MENIYFQIKIIIATNHVSYVRNFIEKEFDLNYLDYIIISVEIGKIKLNYDFYNYIVEKNCYQMKFYL